MGIVACVWRFGCGLVFLLFGALVCCVCLWCVCFALGLPVWLGLLLLWVSWFWYMVVLIAWFWTCVAWVLVFNIMCTELFPWCCLLAGCYVCGLWV